MRSWLNWVTGNGWFLYRSLVGSIFLLVQSALTILVRKDLKFSLIAWDLVHVHPHVHPHSFVQRSTKMPTPLCLFLPGENQLQMSNTATSEAHMNSVNRTAMNWRIGQQDMRDIYMSWWSWDFSNTFHPGFSRSMALNGIWMGFLWDIKNNHSDVSLKICMGFSWFK